MAKAATIFTGFDGAGEGIKSAGFDLAWGLELDDAIAKVARDNGHNVITGDILQADPQTFEPVDALHLSPPCTRASVANSSAEENEDRLRENQLDIDLARASIRFIETLHPSIVTIENVWGYRKFQSFKGGKKCEGILPALERMGYWIDVQHVNAADFGVPQTRKRLILRAVLGGWVPHLPEPEPWIGWYQAIEDLIQTLPESQFAPWQLERLPEELQTMIFSQDYGSPNTVEDRALYTKEQGEPVFKAQDRPIRAFLVPGGNANSFSIREHDEPARTIEDVNRVGNMPRAFLVNTNQSGDDGVANGDTPAYTLAATSTGDRHKAFLVNGALSGEGGNKTLQIHNAAEPTGTIVSTMNSVKDTRAWLSHGKVVKMTSRALARFQSFPDSYELPSSNALACKGIGNACPPLEFEKIYRQLRDLL